jgi:hypothetical protein
MDLSNQTAPLVICPANNLESATVFVSFERPKANIVWIALTPFGEKQPIQLSPKFFLGKYR